MCAIGPGQSVSSAEPGTAAPSSGWTALRDVFEQYQDWFAWIGIASFALLLASLLLLPVVVGALRTDHFVRPTRVHRHPVLWVLRNVAGGLLITVGVAMLVLPGQGLLTILAGLALAEFPGKHRLERFLARQPAILRTLNWMRKRRKKAPFEPPQPLGD